MQQSSFIANLLSAQHVSGTICPSSGAEDYTDGCGMWYTTLWFTGRLSSEGPSYSPAPDQRPVNQSVVPHMPQQSV